MLYGVRRSRNNRFQAPVILAKEPLRNLSVLSARLVADCTMPQIFSEFPAILLRPAIHAGFQTHFRLCDRQPFPVQIQVHQREAGAQPLVVLLQSPISHLLEAEDTLQYPKRMFYLRSDSRLHPILRLL